MSVQPGKGAQISNSVMTFSVFRCADECGFLGLW
jgi:hypothetical protein